MTPGEHTQSLALRLRTIRFPYGYADLLLNLANDQNSQGHFSKRTNRRCSYLRFRLFSLFPIGFRFFSHPAKDTFQLSLTLLVNYRSRVVFRIGSLCLPYSRAISNARYSGSTTWTYPARIRDFHPLWCAVPGRLLLPGLRQLVSILHISPRFPKEIRFVRFRFHSPLLTESRLISFPPPTEMLQFGGFPFLRC